MVSRAAVLALAASPLCGQSLMYGLKTGLAVTDAARSTSTPVGPVSASSGKSIVGPTVGLRLPGRVSVELDLLRRPLDYTPAGGIPIHGSLWEFPLMVKYRVRRGPVSPYLGAGVAWNRISGGPEVVRSTVTGTPVGGGIEGCFGPFCLSGELRYTRWHKDNLAAGTTGFSKRNQLELLVGITL